MVHEAAVAQETGPVPPQGIGLQQVPAPWMGGSQSLG